jgi:hypothetical protein
MGRWLCARHVMHYSAGYHQLTIFAGQWPASLRDRVKLLFARRRSSLNVRRKSSRDDTEAASFCFIAVHLVEGHTTPPPFRWLRKIKVALGTPDMHTGA